MLCYKTTVNVFMAIFFLCRWGKSWFFHQHAHPDLSSFRVTSSCGCISNTANEYIWPALAPHLSYFPSRRQKRCPKYQAWCLVPWKQRSQIFSSSIFLHCPVFWICLFVSIRDEMYGNLQPFSTIFFIFFSTPDYN